MLNQIKCDPCLVGYQDTYVDRGGTVGFLGSWVKAGSQHGWVMGGGPSPSVHGGGWARSTAQGRQHEWGTVPGSWGRRASAGPTAIWPGPAGSQAGPLPQVHTE